MQRRDQMAVDIGSVRKLLEPQKKPIGRVLDGKHYFLTQEAADTFFAPKRKEIEAELDAIPNIPDALAAVLDQIMGRPKNVMPMAEALKYQRTMAGYRLKALEKDIQNLKIGALPEFSDVSREIQNIYE